MFVLPVGNRVYLIHKTLFILKLIFFIILFFRYEMRRRSTGSISGSLRFVGSIKKSLEKKGKSKI